MHHVGQRHESHGDFSGNPETSLAAYEQAEQIVAVGFAKTFAKLYRATIGEHDQAFDDVIERDAVLEAMRSASIFRHVAANRADALAGRIGGVLQAVAGRGTREFRIDDAGFDHRHAIHRIDAQNFREAIESDQHDVVGKCTTGQTGAGTAWHERHPGRGQRLYHVYDFVLRAGEHGKVGKRAISREPVGIVGHEFGRAGFHPARADDSGKGSEQSIAHAER